MSITLDHVSYTYAPGTSYEASALKDVSVHITDGEFVGIMGKTGCGKSTLIQLIDGLLLPSEGKVLLNGQDINAPGYDRSELRRTVGIVFQYPERQLFETTVWKDVAFGLKHSGLSKEEVSDHVQWAIETMGFDFDKVQGMSPLGFSGGEKRRIAIAGVLATRPEVLILDEPIAGLDPLGREQFLKLMTRLNTDGITILMVSHNADALAEYAQRILILENGALLRDGTSKEVFADTSFLREKNLGSAQVCKLTELLLQQGYSVPGDVTRYRELLPCLLEIGKGELR